MKRPISETLTCYQHAPQVQQEGVLKRRRIENPLFPEKKQPKALRVRFADTLVQSTVIPAVVDQEEKERLFYTNVDFARFAFNERIRRDALILTVAVTREQLKRMRRHSPVIASSSVTMMYHKILSRTEDTMHIMQRKSKSPKVVVVRQSINQQNQLSSQSDVRRNMLVSRAA